MVACTPRPGRLAASGVDTRSPCPIEEEPMITSRPLTLAGSIVSCRISAAVTTV